MQCDYQFDSRPAPAEGVPFRVRQAVLERLETQRLETVQASGRRARAADAVRNRCLREQVALLGRERYQRMRGMMREFETSVAAGSEPPPLRRTPKEHESIRRLRIRRSQEILRTLGIDVRRLKAIRRRAHEDLDRLGRVPKARPGLLVREEETPFELLDGSADTWTERIAPFPGWSSWLSRWWSGSFTFVPVDLKLPAVGQVGVRLEWDNGDASDIDIADANFRTGVGFWFQMPATGLVHGLVKVQNAKSRHAVDLYDEWGWSDSTVKHWNWLTFQAVGVNSSGVNSNETASWYEKNSTDGDWGFDAMAGGTWIWIDVGTECRNYVAIDDVEANSVIDYRWFVEKVRVGSTA